MIAKQSGQRKKIERRKAIKRMRIRKIMEWIGEFKISNANEYKIRERRW